MKIVKVEDCWSFQTKVMNFFSEAKVNVNDLQSVITSQQHTYMQYLFTVKAYQTNYKFIFKFLCYTRLYKYNMIS